jgi:hypothetical protein
MAKLLAIVALDQATVPRRLGLIIALFGRLIGLPIAGFWLLMALSRSARSLVGPFLLNRTSSDLLVDRNTVLGELGQVDMLVVIVYRNGLL